MELISDSHICTLALQIWKDVVTWSQRKSSQFFSPEPSGKIWGWTSHNLEIALLGSFRGTAY